MGTELENLCSLLCIFILHVSILTHASPSPPLLTFGTRHSHGCARIYACIRPGNPVSTICSTCDCNKHNYHYYSGLLTLPRVEVLGPTLRRFVLFLVSVQLYRVLT